MFLLFIQKTRVLVFIFTINIIFSDSVNTISVLDSECNSNSELSVYVKLNNEDAIAGFQFVLYDIPNILSYINVSATNRTADFIVDAAEGEAGVTIIGFSLTGSTISPGEGPIIQVNYNIGTLEFDTIVNLGINASVLSDEDAISIEHNTNDGVITVTNQELMIPNIPENIIAISEQNSISLYWDPIWQAQTYQIWEIIDNQQILFDEVINNSFTILNLDNLTEYCYSITSYNSLGQSDFSDSVCATTLADDLGPLIMYFEDIEVEPGQMFQMPLYLSNYYDHVSGIQIKIIDSPNYLSVNNIQITDRLNEFELYFNEQIDGSILVLIFSLSEETIDPGLGPILLFEYYSETITETTISINLSESILSDNNGNQIEHITENSFVTLKVGDNLDATPSILSLSQNYPNPFNNGTTIHFNALPKDNVKLNIYDAKGRLVKTLFNTYISSGNNLGYNVLWDGTDNNNEVVPSGLYIYNLQTKSGYINKKMVLIK